MKKNAFFFSCITTLLLATNAFAGFTGSCIDPEKNNCAATYFADGDQHTLSNSGDNVINVAVAKNGEKLIATCLLKGNPTSPDKAIPFRADDYPNPTFVCRIMLNGHRFVTSDFHGTVTPAGNTKLVCKCEVGDSCKEENEK